MLVLSRQFGERIIIGEPGHEVSVVIIKQGEYGIKVGVIADDDTPIDREEVFKQRNGHADRWVGSAEQTRPDTKKAP